MDGSSANPTKVDTCHDAELVDARMRELNHRVINSLTMISSIIGIESRSLQDRDGRAALERVRSRIVAVSNLYRILSYSESCPIMEAEPYLRSVAEAIAASVGHGRHVAVEVRAASCPLAASQAVALGLIANEAITNSYKHAFTARERGRIVVSLSDDGAILTLTVSDDGQGRASTARDGHGTTLIRSLAIDLAGDVSVASGSGGTCVTVRFPKLA